MSISYNNSKAVKINSEMRNNLNIYNQRKSEINNYSNKITAYQKELEEKNKEIESLNTIANGDDKKAAKDANKKLKSLQKETEKLVTLINDLESKKAPLIEKQEHSHMEGVQNKNFPEKDDEPSNNPVDTQNAIGEYKEDESFIPEKPEPEFISEDSNERTLRSDDLDAIWNKLHTIDEKDKEETSMEQEEVTPVYEEPAAIEPVYDETPEVKEETPISIFGDVQMEEEPKQIETPDETVAEEVISDESKEIIEEKEQEPEENVEEKIEYSEEKPEEPEKIEEDNELEEPKIIEPTVISEETETINTDNDDELPTSELEEELVRPDDENDQEKIHKAIEQEFPEIEVPKPMDTESKLKNIYEEIDVEPKLLDKSTTRDLKNLTLFVDYNDYTFTFGQQHYNKEALTPEELEKLESIRSYLKEKDFNDKRTIQYNKITAENKRLNRKIVTLSKEFTKTVDRLSKDYVSTTDELTNQVNKAKEQVEIDRVEKVQTQKLNDSLTVNIKEQNEHIANLTNENNKLKETVDNKDKTIKELQDKVKDRNEKIKVFEEKLNTVLGIVKEVKNEKKSSKE